MSNPVIHSPVSGEQTAITSRDYTVNLSDSDPSISFPLSTGEVITLHVQSPSPKTVLRVSQIISPDGSADGPFSPETTFTAPGQGTYKFIIGANLMASEEPYTGSVVVTVTTTP